MKCVCNNNPIPISSKYVLSLTYPYPYTLAQARKCTQSGYLHEGKKGRGFRWKGKKNAITREKEKKKEKKANPKNIIPTDGKKAV